MGVKEDLIKLGVPEKDFSTHAADLYVRKSEKVTKYLETYEFKDNVKTFIDEIDKEVWYDIPFAAGK